MDKDFKPPVEDRIVGMLLITPNDTDLTYQRPDGTRYVLEIRKGKDNYFYTPAHQLELFSTKPEPFSWDMSDHKPQPPMDFSTPWPHNRASL